MSSVYRETISDARLKAIADHVRQWLFSEPPPKPTPPAGGEPARQQEPSAAPGSVGQPEG
jgi:hypothetical protein